MNGPPEKSSGNALLAKTKTTFSKTGGTYGDVATQQVRFKKESSNKLLTMRDIRKNTKFQSLILQIDFEALCLRLPVSIIDCCVNFFLFYISGPSEGAEREHFLSVDTSTEKKFRRTPLSIYHWVLRNLCRGRCGKKYTLRKKNSVDPNYIVRASDSPALFSVSKKLSKIMGVLRNKNSVECFYNREY